MKSLLGGGSRDDSRRYLMPVDRHLRGRHAHRPADRQRDCIREPARYFEVGIFRNDMGEASRTVEIEDAAFQHVAAQYSDHRPSARSTRPNAASSTDASTRTRTLPASSISIQPAAFGSARRRHRIQVTALSAEVDRSWRDAEDRQLRSDAHATISCIKRWPLSKGVAYGARLAVRRHGHHRCIRRTRREARGQRWELRYAKRIGIGTLLLCADKSPRSRSFRLGNLS
jgi:hypothetical protein